MAVRARSPRRWFWLTVMLIGCTLAGIQSRPGRLGQASPPADGVGSLGQPVQSLLTRIGGSARRGWWFVTRVFSLDRENVRLRRQLEQTQSQNELLEEQRQELERLRALLDLRDQADGRTVAARAVARGPSPWFRTVTLNVGRRNGVEPGCAVVSAGGLVGQVYHVTYNSAKVLCLTDKLGSVGARLQPERARGIVGVCKGDGAGACRLIYPDAAADARPGDGVVTSGHEEGSIFPAGLLVGHVVTVQRHPHESALILEIRPAVDADRVEEVLVLLPPIHAEVAP